MKHEWRKNEKEYYQPGDSPEIIDVPEFNYFTIKGEGNPNHDFFSEFIQVLYSLSYAVKMSYKSGLQPEGYFDYTVYPLEGMWDVREELKNRKDYIFSKDDLTFTLMIRQPRFVDDGFASRIISLTKKKKPHKLLDIVRFGQIVEGRSIQMLHRGSYDDEPESFRVMEEFAQQNGLIRKTKVHKEIYLTDARKVSPEKLKTILRFQVESQK